MLRFCLRPLYEDSFGIRQFRCFFSVPRKLDDSADNVSQVAPQVRPKVCYCNIEFKLFRLAVRRSLNLVPEELQNLRMPMPQLTAPVLSAAHNRLKACEHSETTGALPS